MAYLRQPITTKKMNFFEHSALESNELNLGGFN